MGLECNSAIHLLVLLSFEVSRCLLTVIYLCLFIKPAVVSGVHKKMNISLWKAESISLDFGDHQADLLNCKDSIVSNANVKEFWDGFEEISSMLFFHCCLTHSPKMINC